MITLFESVKRWSARGRLPLEVNLHRPFWDALKTWAACWRPTGKSWIWLVFALAGPMVAAAPLRLNEVLVTRVVEHEGQPAFQRGLLAANGDFETFDPVPFVPAASIPSEVIGSDLILASVWFGYDVLGPEALANFTDILVPITIGEASYFSIQPSSEPRLEAGTIPNLSTRGIVEPINGLLIGGFVVQERPRRVLIRGVGPTLGEFEVVAPVADPRLVLFRAGQTEAIASNHDWDQAPDHEALAAASATVGAFALPSGSLDAALLLELPPGAYTAHVEDVANAGGTALLEIYPLP